MVMAEGTVPPLVLGEGSPKSAQVPASVIRGHMLVLGEPQPRAAITADVVVWASSLGAGVLAIDVDGRLTAVMADRAARGALGGAELRVLSPSSTVGVPVAFKPLSGLGRAASSEGWQRTRTWLPQLLATLAGHGPGATDHVSYQHFFEHLLDEAKSRGSAMLTVQSLVQAVKAELAASPEPLSREEADALVASLGTLAEDLRNAALAYGAPVDLPRLLSTPVRGDCEERSPPPRHIDVVLLDHMRSVADRNATITAALIEVFAWCRTQGRDDRLLVVLPEVESPTAFIGARPFSQLLAKRVLEASAGTGLLAVVLPAKLDDPAGLPRFGAVLVERAEADRRQDALSRALEAQGITSLQMSRMRLLNPAEWTLAAGKDWSKWFRFTADPQALRPTSVDPDALGALLPPEARDAFKRRAVGEEECEPPEEGAEGAPADGAKSPPATEHGRRAQARAARAVEESDEMMAYTAKAPARAAADSRLRSEVKELLKRKLEEKERAKDAKRFELGEVDLVEGETPSDEEAAAAAAGARRPVSGGLITDERRRPAQASAADVELHADDLERELIELKAKEDEAAKDAPKEGGGSLWVSLTPEEALLGVPPPGEVPAGLEGAPEGDGAKGGEGGKDQKDGRRPPPEGGQDIYVEID